MNPDPTTPAPPARHFSFSLGHAPFLGRCAR